MIIEFPKRYSITQVGTSFLWVTVPKENAMQALEIIGQQPWVSGVFSKKDAFEKPTGEMDVFLSAAYEITIVQAIAALGQLCEYVMSPPVEMSDELASDLAELLTEQP